MSRMVVRTCVLSIYIPSRRPRRRNSNHPPHTPEAKRTTTKSMPTALGCPCFKAPPRTSGCPELLATTRNMCAAGASVKPFARLRKLCDGKVGSLNLAEAVRNRESSKTWVLHQTSSPTVPRAEKASRTKPGKPKGLLVSVPEVIFQMSFEGWSSQKVKAQGVRATHPNEPLETCR